MAAKPGRNRERIRDTLRRETHDDHESLHRLAAFAALRDGSLGREGYVDLMRRMHGFHAAFETLAGGGLGRFADRFAGYEVPRRAALLATDLACLGAEAPPPRLPAALQGPAGAADLAGMLYVVDGSMIGAGVLAEPAERIAGVEGTAYWRWCRANGGRHWRTLLDLLPLIAENDRESRAMVAAARATFRAFGACFAPSPTGGP